MAAARRGRRGALTPELHTRFIAHLRTGLFQQNAATLIGVHPVTVDQWLAKGRDELADACEQMDRTGRMPPLGRYATFASEVEAAASEVEKKMMGVVTEVATMRGPDVVNEDGSITPGRLLDPVAAFKASTWWLERRHNLRYGRGAMRIGVDLHPPGAAPSDDDDPVDLVMEKLDAIEVNLRAATDDSSSPSTADE